MGVLKSFFMPFFRMHVMRIRLEVREICTVANLGSISNRYVYFINLALNILILIYEISIHAQPNL